MSRSIARDLFRLGWPMFVAQIAIMGSGVIDTMMAGRYNTVDLAAVGIGNSIYVTIFVAMMGVLLALSPIASQLYGAGKYPEIGEEVRQTAWLTLVLSVIAVILLRNPDPFLGISQLAPEVEVRVRSYLDALSLSVPASLMFRLFYSFSTAVSRPRMVMALNLLGLALKIPFNLVFMYGHLGMPALGGVGCGVATAIIAWITCGLGWVWCYLDQDYERYGVFSHFSQPRWREIARILALGMPIGLTFLVDVTSFTFMALFIARLGPLSSGAHQIAANMAALVYMLPLAVGNATGVLVGQAIGANQWKHARAVGIVGLAIGSACSGSVGLLLFLNADTVAGLYSNDPGVRTLAATLLGFVGCYHVFDGMQAVTSSALRGYKRTMVPMLIYAVALWGVGLGGGYLLGLTHVELAWLPPLAWIVDGFGGTPMGAPGFWLAGIMSLMLAGGLVTSYFLAVSRAAVRTHHSPNAAASPL
jgi:MATE family multidrug resistance protein